MKNKNLENILNCALAKKPAQMKSVLTKEMGSRILPALKEKKKEVAKTLFSSIQKKN
jgi:hypothetical protein